MDSTLAIAFFAIVPIVVFFLLRERPHQVGGPRAYDAYDRGITISAPAADQPTPRTGAVNRVAPGKEQRIPPG